MFIYMVYYYLDKLWESGVNINVYLGGTDVEEKTTWVWTDGSPGIVTVFGS